MSGGQTPPGAPVLLSSPTGPPTGLTQGPIPLAFTPLPPWLEPLDSVRDEVPAPRFPGSGREGESGTRGVSGC